MLQETRSAWRRLILAWGELRTSRTRQRTVLNESAMTDEQRKHFDAALTHMDKAFEEMEKVFK